MCENLKALTISHPTDRPNFTYIGLARCEFYISYNTVVAFSGPGTGGWVVCENIWSTTTGKHLNYVEEDKSRRVKYDEFTARLAALEARLNLTIV